MPHSTPGSPAAAAAESHPDGRALEEISDAIDAINILRHSTTTSSPSPADQAPSDTHPPTRSPPRERPKSQFRDYAAAPSPVRAFYRLQHANQTVAYNLSARHDFHTRPRHPMTVWSAMERLDTLLDASDPDTSLTQLGHLLQTAEAIRRDGKPRWMQLTGLVHDLGKLLFFYGARGQWDVVGDTFPVGCAWDARIACRDEGFGENEDAGVEGYQTEFGIYDRGCGMENVMLSWGHDEYLYHICKSQSTLPAEALAMIRYHSFYPWHTAGAYMDLMEPKDHAMLAAVREFNPYDLYSKADDVPSVEELKPYYLELIDEYFPSRTVFW